MRRTIEEILEHTGENDRLFLEECLKIVRDYYICGYNDEFLNVIF